MTITVTILFLLMFYCESKFRLDYEFATFTRFIYGLLFERNPAGKIRELLKLKNALKLLKTILLIWPSNEEKYRIEKKKKYYFILVIVFLE